MATLLILESGKEIQRVKLSEEKEYIIGRDETCDIVLNSKKGISRNHLKLTFVEGNWVVSITSRFGNLYFEGDVIDELLLDLETSFTVPPYEFRYYPQDQKQKDVVQKIDEAIREEKEDLEILTNQEYIEEKLEKSQLISKSQVGEIPIDEIQNKSIVLRDSKSKGSSNVRENTATGITSLTGILSWRDQPSQKRVFKLSEGSCVIGRSSGCDVTIKNNHISRRHFEISKTAEQFYIVDLGSANGTQVNGREVSKNQPQHIESGDRITIMDLSFEFEVVDSRFAEKVEGASAKPTLYGTHLPLPPKAAGAKVIRVNRSGIPSMSAKKSDNKKIFRAMVFILIPFVLFLILTSPDESEKPPQQELSSTDGVPFEKLTPEQKTVVRDSFNLAKNHFLQNKHALCLAEIKKLHRVIPFYENSKELETLCEQALDLERINSERERRKKEKNYVQQRIKAITQKCQSQLGKFRSSDEAKACVAPALELDPEHVMITEYITQIEILEQEKRDQLLQKQKRESRVLAGKRAYKEAADLLKEGDYRNAIKKYYSYLNSSYPDPDGNRSQARRELAVAKTKLDEKVKVDFEKCKKLYIDRRHKDAIAACDKALAQDPDNSPVNLYREKVLSELRRDMKLMYEESILEESLGNVDAAKEKWRQIMELDIPSDEYYRKAKSRLRKYGIGI